MAPSHTLLATNSPHQPAKWETSYSTGREVRERNESPSRERFLCLYPQRHRTQLRSEVFNMTWKGFAITGLPRQTKPVLCAKLLNASKTGTFISQSLGFFPPFLISSPFSLHRDHLQSAMLISNSWHFVLKTKIAKKI